MNFLKKYKVYIILLIIFIVGLFSQNFTNDFNDLFGCGTSPYSDLKSEYCVRAYNKGGHVFGVDRNFAIEPAYLLIPLLEHTHLIESADIDIDLLILGSVYTYAYESNTTWLWGVYLLNFFYWIGLIFFLGWLWSKKWWGKIIVILSFMILFLLPVYFFCYVFLGNLYASFYIK